jgi:hypothetical protein
MLYIDQRFGTGFSSDFGSPESDYAVLERLDENTALPDDLDDTVDPLMVNSCFCSCLGLEILAGILRSVSTV